MPGREVCLAALPAPLSALGLIALPAHPHLTGAEGAPHYPNARSVLDGHVVSDTATLIQSLPHPELRSFPPTPHRGSSSPGHSRVVLYLMPLKYSGQGLSTRAPAALRGQHVPIWSKVVLQ